MRVTTTDEPEAAPAPGVTAGKLGRALLRLPGALLYGCAWLLASALALVALGALAGWRDMRAFTRIEPPGDEDE